MKISFIGGGNMAQALISGLQKHDFMMQDIHVIELDDYKRQQLQATFGVQASADLINIASSDIIVLAVKPQQLKAVANAITPYLNKHCVISIAAGVRLVDLSRWLNNHPAIVRSMPNTPAQIQAGVTALCAMPAVTKEQIAQTDQILSAVGKTIWLDDESKLDAVTAISGSGPAYVFYLIEALQLAALELGLNAAEAQLLSLQTFAGASLLATNSDNDVATLRAQVTSKGGTTEQGILSLENAQVKTAIIQAAKAAAARSVELGDFLSQSE